MRHATPSRDHEQLRRFAASRDERQREQLVQRYLPLARQVARRYARNGEPFDDLFQVASMGLLKAIDRFDPHNGAAFSSYAVPTMTGELRRYFRDRTWAVRPPRDLQERSLRVAAVIERLSADLGRSPTVSDVAQLLELSQDEVLEAMQASGSRDAVSMTAPGRDGDADGDCLQDRLGCLDEGFRTTEHRVELDALTGALDERASRIVRLRFEHDLTQQEIGRVVGVSQMQVSRVLRAALATLRDLAAAARAGAY